MQRIRSSPLWRSSLLRFFGTYCALAFLIIVLLGGALSLLFSGLMVRDMTEAGIAILRQLQTAQEFILQTVERSNQEILLDPWIASAMGYYESRSMSVLQQIRTRISNVQIADESIWSLCVYYIDEDIVLSSDASFQPLAQYADAAFLTALLKDESYTGNAYVRDCAKPGPDPSARVISFVSRYPFNSHKSPRILLIANIKASYLEEMLKLIHASESGGLILYDARGNYISGSGLTQAPEDIAALGQRLNSYTPAEAYDFTTADGSRLRLMRFESGMYGWQYVYALPTSTEAAKRGEVLALAASFSALALVCGMLTSWALSKHAVQPLRKLSDLVHEETPIRESEIDVTSITDSVASLVKEAKSVKAVLTEYWMSKRSLILRDLTLGNIASDDDVTALLAQYGIDLNMNAVFAVFTIAMHGYGSYLAAYKPAEKNLHRIVEHEEIINALPEGLDAYCLEMRDNEKVLVCQVPREAMEEGQEDARTWRLAMAAGLADALEQRLRFSYSVGVSRICQSLLHVPNAYLEASFALADRVVWSGQKAILYDWFVHSHAQRPPYPNREEKNLLQALRGGDRRGSLEALDQFRQRLEGTHHAGGAALRNDYIRLYFAMMQIVYELNLTVGPEDMSSVETFTSLYYVDAPMQYAAVLAGWIDQLLLMMGDREKHKQNHLVQRIVQHIDTHLADDLSAAALSTIFYMSATGLRRLFKETTGMTLKEYSLQARMNHAIVLLGQHVSVQEVSAAVGYASPQAFINAFKQATGVSPTQYHRNKSS